MQNTCRIERNQRHIRSERTEISRVDCERTTGSTYTVYTSQHTAASSHSPAERAHRAMVTSQEINWFQLSMTSQHVTVPEWQTYTNILTAD